jgi:predicted ATP-grasp superfamily ATP-dependent carboligase
MVGVADGTGAPTDAPGAPPDATGAATGRGTGAEPARRTRYREPFMQPLRWDHRPSGLRAPALVCAFKGWNDAGESASSALTFVGAGLDAERFAVIDPEEFVDFQATRPTVRLAGGQTRRIDWPDIEIYEARVPRAPRDLVLLAGPEPAYRWRTFCETVVELAEALGVQLVVTLGALLADVPHSRPVHVSAYASDDALVNRLGLAPPTYEGPTGIVGVLHDACASAGMPSASLWAAVPHYVAVVPNPKGALALLRRLESLIGVTVDAAELEDAAAEYERQVSRAVEMDPDVQAFVEKLERAADEEERSSEQTPLPSGDVLAREFQRFLRQRGTPPGDR